MLQCQNSKLEYAFLEKSSPELTSELCGNLNLILYQLPVRYYSFYFTFESRKVIQNEKI